MKKCLLFLLVVCITLCATGCEEEIYNSPSDTTSIETQKNELNKVEIIRNGKKEVLLCTKKNTNTDVDDTYKVVLNEIELKETDSLYYCYEMYSQTGYHVLINGENILYIDD